MSFFKSATTVQPEDMKHPVAKLKSVRKNSGLLAGLGVAAFMLLSTTAQAQTAPALGTASTFGVLASTYTNTTAGTAINGNLGYTTGPAVTPTVTGTTFVADATYNQAVIAQNAAQAAVMGQACTSLGPGAVLLAGSFAPGCYSSGGAMNIAANGIVTLNGSGVFIFRPNGAFTSGANSQIVMAGGACANDVFWAPTGAMTLGATSTFSGTIIDAAGITMGSGSILSGRALAAGGTVTTDANAITVPNCAAQATLPSIRVTKVSNGGVDTFSFSGNNGFANQSITTVTPGTGVTGATQTLAAAGVSTTITEAVPPAGYTLASISCGGLGAGGTQTPNIATRSVTLDAAATAAGAAIACTFTNNAAGFVPPVTSIPTLSEWAMMLLAGLMAIAGFAAIRRKGM